MSIVEQAAERLKRQHVHRPATLAEDDVAADARRPGTLPEERRAPVRIDEPRLRKIGLLPPETAVPWMSRELQRIKRPIINAMNADAAVGAHPANRLMIASANPGDGKSFTTFNLAMSLADELDYSVLLIDGDIAKPSISRALGLEEAPGLMHLLSRSDVVAEDCVVPTGEPRLSILPAGQRGRRVAESLASRRMKAVLDELSADPARILIFDSAPLLATAESQTLATNMGQILLIVRAEHTEKRAVEAALSLIESARADISLVLTQGRQVFEDRYAGYYGMYPAEPSYQE